MPQDIRSFFGGGGGSGGGAKSATPKATPKTEKKSRTSRKVISDDEDEEVVKPKKVSTPAKKSAAKPKTEETTSSAYFASNKAKSSNQSTPAKKTATSAKATPAKNTNGATPSSGRRSARKTGNKNYAEDDDEAVMLVDDKTGNDDIFADNFKSRKADDDYEEGSSDDDEVIKPKGKRNGVKKEDTDDDELETAEIVGNDGGNDSKRKSTAGRKRKAKEATPDDEEDEEDETPKKKAKKSTTKAAPKKPRAKKEPVQEDEATKELMDSIPTIRAPTPPPRDEDRKFTYAQGGGNANAAPAAAGMKEIPEGAEDCLLGLTFVFTGVLESIGREEGQSLVKRYGGKVTGAPSGKTDFVVLGNDAGPKKLETIRKLGIKTINEDGLFELIRRRPAAGGTAAGAEVAAKKRAEQEAKVKAEAQEMERKEKEREKEEARIAEIRAQRTGTPAKPRDVGPRVDDRLLVDKYAPDALSQVCGNKTQVEKLQKWLRGWKRNQKFKFKKAGEDGTGVFRAAMLHGPPGVGKTTAAHLIAKLEGYDVVETNASDTRSKKMMEAALKGVLDTTSIMGYFAGEGKAVDHKKQNLVLIMDEVDGMSAGDRGGVGALAAVAKKTNIPLILICNERKLPKMKPFDFVTADIPFRRPTTDQIRSRIMSICFREGIKLTPPVLNAIIEGANADIRRIINMLSTIKVDARDKDMNFNDSKAMHKAWEKHVILKPWDIVSKIMRPQMFAESSNASLNEKTELYFNDHEFSYLMMQENYLKSVPSRLGNLSGKERNLKYLELADDAASSMSDGDLVDRMIHGSQQQWSLMPLHAIFSFVRPASYMHGNFNTQVGFASWLGQNSKQGKLSRYVKELQGHMRLKTAADRHEIRQQYMPALWNGTVGKLLKKGKEAVPDMIDFMDSYYLTKDDYDAIVELGVGPMVGEGPESVLKNIDTQTKSTFTRLYNSQSHPMPFVKATATLGVSKGAAKRDKPDLEEAIEDDDEGVEEVADEGEEDDAEADLKKDKYIKAPKKKKAAATKGKAAAGGKRKKAATDDDDDESVDEKPAKKGRGGGAAGRGRGRGRGR